MTCYDYKIAVGHDNVAGLALVSSITDGTDFFTIPSALGSFDLGDLVIGSNGLPFPRGFAFVIWRLVMTSKQYMYWRTTYANGTQGGLVTIRTATEELGEFANYNATMIIPKVSEVTRTGKYYDVSLRMTRLELIPPPPP